LLYFVVGVYGSRFIYRDRKVVGVFVFVRRFLSLSLQCLSL
jgi:hypothetical protein